MTESPAAPHITADQKHRSYVIIGCALAVVAIAAGIQQTFGLFMLPISKELGWGREVLSLAFCLLACANAFGRSSFA
jgi:hypothetical protein